MTHADLAAHARALLDGEIGATGERLTVEVTMLVDSHIDAVFHDAIDATGGGDLRRAARRGHHEGPRRDHRRPTRRVRAHGRS